MRIQTPTSRKSRAALGLLLVGAAVTALLLGTAHERAARLHSAGSGAGALEAGMGSEHPVRPSAERRWQVASAESVHTSFNGDFNGGEPRQSLYGVSARDIQGAGTPGRSALLTAAQAEHMSPALAALARADSHQLIEVMISHEVQPTGAERARIEALGGQVLRQYDNFPYTAALVPANRLGELVDTANVSFMDVNARVYSTAAASTSAWQTAHVPAAGTGAGTLFPVSSTLGVAVVDSGVANHPDLNVVSRNAFNDARTSFFGTLYDGFLQGNYAGSAGTDSWSGTPWIEHGDDGNSGSGAIHIQTGGCPAGSGGTQCLSISANSSTSTWIERQVPIIGSSVAYFDFRYALAAKSANATLVAEVSSDGGVTWSAPLQTINTVGSGHATLNISSSMSAKTRIRFRISQTDPSAQFSISDVQIWYRTGTAYYDNFFTLSYNNLNNWGESWFSPWVESGDGATGATAGNIRVETSALCASYSNCLRIDAATPDASIQRSVNLSGQFQAVLRFDYALTSGTTRGAFALEASSDGSTWQQLALLNQPGLKSDARFDVSKFVSANTRLRFRVATAAAGTTLRVNNFEVDTQRGDTADQLGHGTHVAGIIGGNGGSSGNYPGIAQGARIHQVRVLDDLGRGTVADLLAGLDWIYSNGAAAGIKVVNMSLGMGVSQGAAADPLAIASDKLWDAGFVVVAAAGNYGLFGNMSITSPGISRKIITVGSLTDSGTGTNFADDYVSTYSSRGPTLVDHALKPDLLAPGNRIVSTVLPTALLPKFLPANVPACGTGCTGNYMQLSGTSMATPVVSGAALLMLTADPSLSPSTVKARLMRSARKVLNADPTAYGAGVLDVQAALKDTGVVSGQALSPLVQRSNVGNSNGTAMLVEDTAKLWGSSIWGAGYLWQNGYLWSSKYTTADGYLWSDGYLWQNGYLWSNGYLWNNGYLWQNGYLWSSGYLWQNAVSSADGLDTTRAATSWIVQD